MVDRLLALSDAFDGKYREAINLVVVAGVVAERPFRGHLAGVDYAFEHDLGAGRHLQVRAATFDQLGALAAQQAGKGVLGQAVGYRRYRAQNGRRVGAQHHRNGEGLTGVLFLPLTKVQSTAAVAQPAHDDLVAADHLLAIDTQILPFLVRPLGNHQAPGDQRAGIARPAGLDRNAAQIDIVTFKHLRLAGGVAQDLGRHVDDFLEDRQLAPGVFQPLRRIGLLEKGQQLADLAQLADALGAHTHGHALGRTKEVAEYWHVRAGGVFK